MTSSSSGAAIPGFIVTVAGTSISSGLDAAGRFSLKNVPIGDVELQFSGPVTATLPVSQVKPLESIDLVIALSGNSATLESQFRATAGDEQLEGRVESLPPTMPAGSLKIGGRTVTTDASTQIRQGGTTLSFAALAIGQRVHVKGRTSGASMLATSIEIQNVITSIPVTVNGVVSDFTGSASLFQFKVDRHLVRGDDASEFFGGSAFAELANGVRVEVKGQQRDGHVYAERIHINRDGDDDDDEQDSSASIHGTLTSLSGSGSALTLVVGGTTARTNAGTEVKRRGDVQTLAALKVGQELHVVGTRESDGSLIARRIEINDDAPGGEFEIEGSVGGLSGTCPAKSFKVNGYSIQTSASTVFEDTTCAALKNGMRVDVKGLTQSDGTVLATRARAR